MMCSAKPYPNIMFFCSLCRPRMSLALKFFNEIEEKCTQLKARLVQLEQNVAQPILHGRSRVISLSSLSSPLEFL